MESDPSAAIRGKDWIFNIFWASCAESSLNFQLLIPDTFLFRNGEPYRGIGANLSSGLISRIELDNAIIDRKSEEIGLRGDINRKFRILRQRLIETQDLWGYRSSQQDEDRLICKVFYNDGEEEEIALRVFDVLIRNSNWRQQVLMIQSYVHSMSSQMGFFQLNPKVRSLLDSDGAEAADQLCRSIAKFSEKVYLQSNEPVPGQSNHQAMELKVKEFRGIFAVDTKDRLVFMNTVNVLVEIKGSGQKQLLDYFARERESRDASAAASIVSELYSLLSHAGKRGLPVQESFSHFDLHNCGYVDVDSLLDGLSRLGIGASYPVGEHILQSLGGIGSSFLTLHDFDRFLSNPPDIAMLDTFERNGNSKGNTFKFPGKEKKGKFTVLTHTSKDGKTRKVAISNELRPIKAQLQDDNDEDQYDENEEERNAVESLSFDLGASQSQSWRSLDDHHASGKKEDAELPVPADKYTTGNRNRGPELPSWATKRQHRALKELQRSQEEWIKKNPTATTSTLAVETSLPGLSPTSQLGGDSSPAGSSPSSNSLNLSTTKFPTGSSITGNNPVSSPKRVNSRSSSTSSSASLHRKSSKETKSKSKSKSKSKLNLSLQSLHQESLETPNAEMSKDELLYIEDGVVMTYRILPRGMKASQVVDSQSVESNPNRDLQYRNILQQREKKMGESSSSDPSKNATEGIPTPSHIDREVCFTLFVLPDLFSTLENLENQFDPLLTKFPSAQVVLVGFPGLPNTIWPAHWILNTDLHIRCLGYLLRHLRRSKRLSTYKKDPIFMLGVGMGGFTLSKFVYSVLEGFPWLERRLKCLIFVNSMMKINKGFLKLCKDLRQSLLQAGSTEVNELITSLHFWDHYLSVEGRQSVFQKFWECRQGLYSNAKMDLTMEQNNGMEEPSYGKGFVGVLEMLKGILMTPEEYDASMILTSSIPILTIQSTEDIFVDPRNGTLFQADQIPPERKAVTDIADALDENAVFLGWLKAGHEVLQERQTYFLGLISSLAQICGIHPVADAVNSTSNSLPGSRGSSDSGRLETMMMKKKKRATGKKTILANGEVVEEVEEVEEVEDDDDMDDDEANGLTSQDNDEVFDVLALMEKRKKRVEEERIAKEKAEVEELVAKRDQRRREKEEKYRLEQEAQKAHEEEVARQEKLAAEDAERAHQEELLHEVEAERMRKLENEEREKSQNDKRKERLAAEKEKRAQLASERKKREAKAALRAEMDVIYEREREIAERKAEKKELQKMRKEDERSRFAAEYAHEQELIVKSAELAKEKASALNQARREEALKRVEDQMAIERSKRMEERRKKAEKLVQDIDNEQIVFQGELEGGYDIPVARREDVIFLIANTDRLQRDLLHARQQSVEALKRQMLIEQKYLLFQRQLESVELDLQRIQRAIRLIELNPSLVGSQARAATEVADLKKSYSLKEETYQELKSLSKQRESQLHSANRRVQSLKIVSKEKDELMNKRLKYLFNLEDIFQRRIRELKMEKEHLIVEKDKKRIQEILLTRRIDALKREINRIRNHNDEYVDTDVWVDGVLQRLKTQDLKNHLNRELMDNENKKKTAIQELNDARDGIIHCSDRISLTRRNCDKIGIAAKSFQKSYQRYAAVTVSDLTKNLNDHQESAQKLEDVRRKDKDLSRMLDVMEGNGDIIDKIRLKDPELRTKDERKYLGLDMILNPEGYIHLTSLEIEQMKFDKDYHCDLSASDLKRIRDLPEQIQLALPFLNTDVEVDCHRLFNKFFRSKDEAHFRMLDFMSEGVSPCKDTSNNTDDSRSVGSVSIAGSHSSVVESEVEKVLGVTSKDMHEAEIIHDILVKESRRDRVRGLGEGEEMTQEEREWLQLDRILSPHLFEPEEKIPIEVQERNIEVDLSTSVVKVKKLKNVTHPKEELKPPIINRIHEGDIHDQLRERYVNGEIVFDFSWRCPFTRDELLKLRSSTAEPTTDDQRKVIYLMEKYYVDDNESILGHSRLMALSKVTHEIFSGIERIDRLAEAEDKVRQEMLLKATQSGNYDDLDNENIIRHRSESISGSIASANKNDEDQEDDASSIKRIWGSWESVHPASAGAQSQESYFLSSAFNAARDHPASYAIHEDLELNSHHDDDDDMSLSSAGSLHKKLEGQELLNAGLEVLKSHPAPPRDSQFDTFQNDPNSKWFIFENTREIAAIEPKRVRGKTSLLAISEPKVLFETKDLTLQARQSRSHRFQVPDRDDTRVLEIIVSIVFQGAFSTRGYRLGRLAASLFRLPQGTNNDSSAMPIPVGYAPYASQTPNLPEAMGKILILHRPRARPLKPGEFQIVLGAASSVKYSIEVSCKYAQTALPIVDDLVTKARELQARLPICLKEIEDLSESLRLAERKLLVCGKMIDEAESESQRCLKLMKAIQRKLDEDDEEMTLFEDERREFQRELAISEVEYAQWATLFASRCREQDDIKDGIKMMHNMKRERQQEKEKLKKELEDARSDLPACIAVLRSFYEASNVAASLNTIVQGPSAAYGLSATGDAGEPIVSTPAEDIRRRVKREGFNALTLEEQQWCVLDQASNPQKYEWLREQEEQENAVRITRGKAPKVKKYNAAVEAFRYTKPEIDTIMTTPFSLLSRREMQVRKLFTKFHDDPEIIKKAFAVAAYGFDPHLAERTRAKNSKSHNKEEKEWASLDRILHPEIWKYYVNDDLGKVGRSSTNAIDPIKSIGSSSSDNASISESIGNGSSSIGQQRLDDNQKQVIDKMGKLLGMEDSLSLDASSLKTDHLDLSELASSVHKKMTKEKLSTDAWVCPFDREKILKIWRTPRHKLKSDDERTTYRLLLKYNGTYKDYMQNVEQSKIRQQKGVKTGEHVRWDAHGNVVTKDVDLRARELLREVDRATFSKSEWMNSFILHGNDQKFPTRVLRVHLEEALDNLLSEQIKERERAEKKRIDSDSDGDDNDDTNPNGDDSDLSIQDEDESADLDLVKRIQKRAKRREKRNKRIKQSTQEEDVLAIKKKMVGLKNKTGAALAEAILQNQLGVGGCLACHSNPCKWKPCVDMEVCMARKRILDKEIERVKLDKESSVIVSEVCLSAQLGGNTTFKRLDLLDELTTEVTELENQMHLNNVDKELHDAYATRKEFVEVKHLHGYATMMWTNNARLALKARQQRMVATIVAKEVVDNILDWMLDGWMFGERESTYSVQGFVPSLKKDGPIRSGQDQIQSITAATKKMKTRADARKKGVVLDEARRGNMQEKSKPIEEESQIRIRDLKVARDGNAYEHNLNETESTLKFGLFMLTLMYFRAMVFLRREKRSWGGDDDQVGGKSSTKPAMMTQERMRMLDEENKVNARKKKLDVILQRYNIGEQRRKEREAAERRDAILRLQAIIKRQKLETDSICTVQRVFRGHIGRKAAKRWALKRAELGAMNALLNAASIFVQRVYRGYRARCLAIKKRIEMAQFIALMRAQEAASDENVFWETHPWQRFKRNQKEWFDTKFRKAHQVQVLGAAKLTEEEQDRMLGEAMQKMENENDEDEHNVDDPNDNDAQGIEEESDDDNDESKVSENISHEVDELFPVKTENH